MFGLITGPGWSARIVTDTLTGDCAIADTAMDAHAPRKAAPIHFILLRFTIPPRVGRAANRPASSGWVRYAAWVCRYARCHRHDRRGSRARPRAGTRCDRCL